MFFNLAIPFSPSHRSISINMPHSTFFACILSWPALSCATAGWTHANIKGGVSANTPHPQIHHAPRCPNSACTPEARTCCLHLIVHTRTLHPAWPQVHRISACSPQRHCLQERHLERLRGKLVLERKFDVKKRVTGKGGRGWPFVVARHTYKSEKLVSGVSTPAEAMVSWNWPNRGTIGGSDGWRKKVL